MRRANIAKLGFLVTAITIGCSSGTDDTLMTEPNPIPPGGALTGTTPGGGAGPSTGPLAPKGPAPDFGAQNVTLANSPPPISGGTLLALSDGTHVVAADSDRDRVYIVNVTTGVVTPIALNAHDEPGRVVEDAIGQVHVVLRSAGAIATIDVASATLTTRRNVCASPRGIALDSSRARLVIACETGEVVTMAPAIEGAPSVLTTLASGLRDVVILQARNTNGTTDASIFVSRFRTAEVMHLSMNGALLGTTRPSSSLDPTLAWRMIAPLVGTTSLVGATGGSSPTPIIVHQLASNGTVTTSPSAGGYTAGGNGGPSDGGTSCSKSAIVTPAISQGTSPLLLGPSTLVVPVDMVATENGFAVISAGNGHTASLPQLFVLQPGACGSQSEQYKIPGQPTAVTRLANGSLVVQSREPAMLTMLTAVGPSASIPSSYVVNPSPIVMATDSVEDTGHAIFHSNSGGGIACASCHGEGADDSHVWTFDTEGARRTPSLRGTINGTAPYHWDGAMTDIGMLADTVMTGRMNGPQLSDGQKSALQSWLFAIPAPALATTGDAAQIAQGKALFESASVGCSGCHSGPRFTNNATVNVGTGGSFQVPPLVGVRARAPYLHDGCAATLQDRFGKCATPQHGNTSQLQPSDIDALVAYLESI